MTWSTATWRLTNSGLRSCAQFQSLITGRINEDKLTLVDCHYYSSVSTQNQRIADHAAKIAGEVSAVTKANKEFPGLQQDTQAIIALLKKAGQMVKTINKQAAHSILDDFHDLKKRPAPGTLVSDSLERVQRYVLNIAELTIDYVVMTD